MIREITEITVHDGPVYVAEEFGQDFLVFRNGQLIAPKEYTFYTEQRLLKFHDDLVVGDTVQVVA